MEDASKQILEDLRSVVSSSGFVLTDESLEDYVEDMGGYEGVPLVVVKPRSEEEISKIVKIATRWHIPIVARGAGTSLTGAVVLKNAIILDMSNFNRVLNIDTVNWNVRVQAGVVLDDLNQELKKFGFFFPPDPASSFACTVGGAVSEGSGGMRCLRYGTMKDWVLSIRLVLHDGAIVTFGEPLYKNRAGYDLVHLVVGSEGTLGIITEVHLKIIPIPQVSSKRMLVYFADWALAGDAIRKMRESLILPLLLEFMDRETIHEVNKDLEHKLEEVEAVLLLDIEEAQLEIVSEILKASGASSLRIAKDENEAEELYQARAMAYLSLKSSSTGVQIEDVVLPLDHLAEYLVSLKEISKKYGMRIPVMGHAGDGNVHPVVLFDKNNEDERKKAQLAIEEFCEKAIRLGGSITGEHGVGTQKLVLFRSQILSHNGEEVLTLMKEVKKIFDPNLILNPGKYVEAA